MLYFYFVLSLIAYTAMDLLGKKLVDENDAYGPLRLRRCVMAVFLLAGFLLYFAGAGESGLAPWTLLAHNPIMIAVVLCSALMEFLYLFSLRYIGLSVQEAFSGSVGIFFFIGTVAVHLVGGQLSAVRELLHPARLIPVLLLLGAAFLLPNAERFSRRSAPVRPKADGDRKRTVIGCVLLAAALIFDALEMLLTSLVLDSGRLGAVDFMMTGYFFVLFPLAVFSFLLRGKRRPFSSVPPRQRLRLGLYCILPVAATVFYALAAEQDAVRTGVLFSVYPVLPIIGAGVFLKERYTRRQTLCIWLVTLSAAVFCVVDNLL